ncbi:MAG TPA: TIGR03086 family metal-binding protein [Streptosporangiaceae bacterium]|nr:TIGR03086 family metal-binding protein [Streptosporangiaceae bacterium]
MSSDTDSLALLESALDQTGAVIAAIDPSQAELATPCRDWDVRALVRHVTGQSLRNFAVTARGQEPDWQTPADELGEDWAGEFRTRAAELLAAWKAADPEKLIEVPGGRRAPLRSRADQQIAELAVHAWDLAQATGQHADLDPAVAEHALDWSHQTMRPEFRGPDRWVDYEVVVPMSAPAYERLAGWFGRDPDWASADGAPGN